MKKGLILVFTGDGKGKTTAALGMALRATGHGLRVLVIQFIKGSREYGELRSTKDHPLLKIVPMGRGFINLRAKKPLSDDIETARKAWSFCREQVISGKYDLIILDEISYLVAYHLLPIKEVLNLLKNKPPPLHLVLTGRQMPPEIIDIADLVTEMNKIKHPYEKGIGAQPGIEY
jgi:cob(I)alamin adenosyltransferase